METAGGKPYEISIKDNICTPLGMADTRAGGWPASETEPNQPRGHYPQPGKIGSVPHKLDDE